MAPTKRIPPGKPSRAKKSTTNRNGFAAPSLPIAAAIPPLRGHGTTYHFPLLLSDRAACDGLLGWFEGVEETRSMPWRKKWIDPREYAGREDVLGEMLTRRAYEVWVSEVMLQQTRVSTVIPYFNNWISKWPTIEDLAEANLEVVLSAWRGLGYYSRATRLHEGAKVAIEKAASPHFPIPSKATALQDLPGIGRYTAGAISSIAFGEAEPVLDGNVARVLSRQLGLYVDVKEKNVSDILWDEADRLIKFVADVEEDQTSDVPGKWNQALMELGSTVCTPRPQCGECPIQATCRAYNEGQALSNKRQSSTAVPDIEDACTLCESLDTEDLVTAPEVAEDDEEEPPKPVKKRKGEVKQSNTLSSYFTIPTRSANTKATKETEEEVNMKKRKLEDAEKEKHLKSITTYCALFPKKVAKKKAAEQECVVCMIELCLPDKSSRWLIEQRPAKGLLASLWQFPQCTLPSSATTSEHRKAAAQDYLSTLELGDIDMNETDYVADFPPIVHVFTHLRLTMHAYQFRIKVTDADAITLPSKKLPARKWIETESMDGETLSTWMRKCWDLLR